MMFIMNINVYLKRLDRFKSDPNQEVVHSFEGQAPYCVSAGFYTPVQLDSTLKNNNKLYF